MRAWLGEVDPDVDPALVEVAHRRALALAAETGSQDMGRLAYAGCVAEALAAAIAQRRVTRAQLSKAFALLPHEPAAEDVIRDLVFILATRSPSLLCLPPVDALHAELQLLSLFAPITEASFWSSSPDDPLYMVTQVGRRAPTRTSRAAARRAIFGAAQAGTTPHASIHSLPVFGGAAAPGALVVRTRPAEKAPALRLAKELVGTLELILNRNLLLEQTAAGGQSIVEVGERRLRRIGLDLHDGPLQELARLHGDLQMVRSRLIALGLTPELMPVARDLDVVLSLAAGVEGNLRDMSRSLGLPPDLTESFADAVASATAAVERADIQTSFQLTGDPEAMTQSQRIAVLRIIEEALTNISLHSGARHVEVDVRIDDGGVHLEIVDDGAGFDVERVLRTAPRHGRLGLIGMRERARLLDGAFAVTSRPGGPSRVVVSLPPWRPTSALPTG